MKMIKILHVGLGHSMGGMENMVMNYYRHIDRREFAFDFLDLYGDGFAFTDEIRSLGGEIYCFGNYRKNPVNVLRELHLLLVKYDILHIHMMSAANLIPILAAYTVKNVVVVCHSHADALLGGKLKAVLHVVNSHYIRRMAVKKWACGISAGKWMWGNTFGEEDVVPNVIEVGKFRRNDIIRERYRIKCGFSGHNKVIGFVGRFDEQKNPLFLIDILEALLRISGEYRLLTVGGGHLFDDFCLTLKKRKLDRYCFSAGVQKDVADWYQPMDALVLPSIFEGFPMVGIEAQAAGLMCFFSENITSTIDISGNCRFLPIGFGNHIAWVNEINSCVKNGNYVEVDMNGYDAEVMTVQLEQRYRNMIFIGN